MIALVATGLVFWFAHAYSRFVGDRQEGDRLNWAEVRSAASREWPLAETAWPPAAVAAFCWLVGLPDSTAAWAALATAVAGQVGWALIAAAKTGATRGVVALSGLANLLLGLTVVMLKAVLH